MFSQGTEGSAARAYLLLPDMMASSTQEDSPSSSHVSRLYLIANIIVEIVCVIF